jgi:hypothetical protein
VKEPCGPAAERPDFRVVWRGYDRRQVEEYIRRTGESTEPQPAPAFDVVLRGYDRRAVDRYLQNSAVGRRAR